MGCDIHTHLEVQIDDRWYYYAPVELWRNYNLFSLMAGVRGDETSPKPISLPRGLPNDVTFMTKCHSNDLGGDGHSHSYLDYNEITEVLEWIDGSNYQKPWGAREESDDLKWADFGVWLFRNSIKGFKEYPESYPEGLQDIRLVFWFDN